MPSAEFQSRKRSRHTLTSLTLLLGMSFYSSIPDPKEAILSTIKQKISLILWDFLSLDPANQTGEAQERLALLRKVTLEGGKGRDEGPMCPYTSVWARKRV